MLLLSELPATKFLSFGDMSAPLEAPDVDPDPAIQICNSKKNIVPSVADPDPGSGGFLTPGSGIPDPEWVFSGSRISDPGSQTHIFECLV
jgi:hypothetical protein